MEVTQPGPDREWVSGALAELVALEDQRAWHLDVILSAARRIEEQAAARGAVEISMRARVLAGKIRLRQGEVALTARLGWEINSWALEHDSRPVRVRTHLLLAQVYHKLGDPPSCLEQALLAVEHLDDTDSAVTHIAHWAKLADALWWNGSLDGARGRYQQAADLAVAEGQTELHMMCLNNLAYGELSTGSPERAWQVAETLRRQATVYGYELDPDDLDTIAQIQAANGWYADAEQTMYACLAVHEKGCHDDADALAEYLLTMATAQRGQGAMDRAQASLDRSGTLCAERDLGELRVRVIQEQAELYAAAGDHARAFATYKEFFAAHEKLRSHEREAQAQTRQVMFETAEARQEAERFREQAHRDALTGLRNRRYADERLPRLLTAAVSDGTALTVAVADLDHFKRINDTLSHDTGDRVLVTAAKIMDEVAASVPGGFAARLGGEEFLLVLPGLPVEAALPYLERVRVRVREYPWRPVVGELPVTVSIGVTDTCGVAGPTREAMLSVADRNLYGAKRAGRDRVVDGRDHGHRRRRYRDAAAS